MYYFILNKNRCNEEVMQKTLKIILFFTCKKVTFFSFYFFLMFSLKHYHLLRLRDMFIRIMHYGFFFFLTLLNCKNITDCSALRRPKHSYNLAFYASWGSYEKGSTRKCCTPMTDTERNLWKPRRNVILQFTPLLTCKDNRLGPVLSWSQIPASQAGFLKIIPIGCL